MSQIDTVAQGRIWDGGTARQIGLVDQFGSLDDALGWVAGQAKLGKGEWSALYLGENANPYASLIEKISGDEDGAAPEADIYARIAQRQRETVLSAVAGAERLVAAQGAQAYCLGCPVPPGAARTDAPAAGWLAAIGRALFRAP